MKKIPHLRWWVAVLLLGAAVLNYCDRQTLSSLAPTVQRDLGMDDRDYANVVNVFLLAYTLAYLFSGRLTDRLGTRRSMALFVVWWSLSNALTAAATGFRSLAVVRISLGLGEAGVWPAASKAVSEWFPARERALAIGVYTMGATIGATIAPYLVIPLAGADLSRHLPGLVSILGVGAGWRLAFIVTGLAGLLWMIPWLSFYCLPARSLLLSESERAHIESGQEEATAKPQTPWTWSEVFRSPIVWLLLVGRLLTDPVWYFFQFWFPKYLNTGRGLAQGDLTVTWIVYAAAGAGSLVGGWLSGHLVRRGMAPTQSRMVVMLGSAVLVPLSPLIASVSGLSTVLALTAVVIFASLSWLINISAMVNDLIPRHSLGTVFSVVAAGSTLGGVIMNLLVAAMVSGPAAHEPGFLDAAFHRLFSGIFDLVQGRGYGFAFGLMAFLYPAAWLILYFSGIAKRTAVVQPAAA